jgi:hypothetical protein
MKISYALLLLMLSACSTGIVQTDAGIYMIARRSAQVGGGPPVHAQAKAYQTANDFCARQGRVVETIKLDTDDGTFGHPGSVDLRFKCVTST